MKTKKEKFWPAFPVHNDDEYANVRLHQLSARCGGCIENRRGMCGCGNGDFGERV